MTALDTGGAYVVAVDKALSPEPPAHFTSRMGLLMQLSVLARESGQGDCTVAHPGCGLRSQTASPGEGRAARPRSQGEAAGVFEKGRGGGRLGGSMGIRGEVLLTTLASVPGTRRSRNQPRTPTYTGTEAEPLNSLSNKS